MLPVLDPGHDLPLCCSITGKLIGNHDAGGPHLLLQQLSKEPLGSLLVASALDQYVKYHPALIDRTPEPMLLTRNLHHDLVQMPLVSSAGQPAADLIGECLAELEAPLPHGLVAEDDATSRQHLLDHAQAQRKAEVEPDRVADDLGREAVAAVAGGGTGRHSVRLRDPSCPGKPLT